ncbi:hypothetical protein DFH06DRAFT_1131940 [Mycena polygramma]|nr:hypothetical protein DFH06DRAFT_1131940 [Mycena polygramma]
MSKQSIITSSSTPSFASPSIYAHDIPRLPTALVTTPSLYGEGNLIEVNKVRLGTKSVVYHAELWRGKSPPATIMYENPDTLELYALHTAPLSRVIQVTAEDRTMHQEYEFVLPPYNTYRAGVKTLTGTDPDFSGDPHRVTHHDPSSAKVWGSAFIESPDHLLFQMHRSQNQCRLHHGSTMKAPCAWMGTAVVTEKLGECKGWTVLELRLLTSGATIYLRVLSELVAMDRTCYGRLGRWIRVTTRRMRGRYDDVKHAR